MAKVTNQFYKAFLDGYLLEEIDRNDIIKVLNNINHKHIQQARVLIILAWGSGARPNEYLKLKKEDLSRSTEFLEVRFLGSKGSSARTISFPRYMDDGSEDPLILEVFDYYRKLFPGQWLFWFFRSNAVRYGVTKKIKTKDGQILEKKYDKVYDYLSSKLNYYFRKWFDVLVVDGVPPYYLRHNRASKVFEKVGSAGTMETTGHKRQESLKSYTHKTKKMRKEIGKALMK